MIRKFNYTGRKKIKRNNVRIDILRDSNGQRLFNISLQVSNMQLPANAHVFVEAYHRTAYQRFDFGTIARRKIPTNRRLSHFSDAATPLFRVKVVDRTGVHGRILAAVDKIRPESVDEQPADSQSLLFVEYEDLGNTIWQLDLEGDWPVLKLNRNVDEISLIASSDNHFLPLVYPEAFRQILTRIMIADDHTDPDCDDDWPSLWLKLACTLPGMTPPPQIGKTEQQTWIDKVVESFSANNKLLEMFNQSIRDAK
ncbi:hypothetical protein ACFL9U_06530 [Thermodesulfobacteriota bacterium]